MYAWVCSIMAATLIVSRTDGSILRYADLLPLVADKEETKSAVDKNGWTPLHFAAANNRPQCIEWLLQNGADKSIRDKSERK